VFMHDDGCGLVCGVKSSEKNYFIVKVKNMTWLVGVAQWKNVGL